MLQNTSSFPRVGAALILAAVALVGVAPLRLVAMPVPPPPPAPPAPVAAPAAPPAAPVARSVTRTVVSGAAEAAVPPAPPAPPAPPRAVVPPAPPAAPAAPAAPLRTQGVIHLSNNQNDGYVLIKGDHNVMNGTVADLREAKQLDDGKGVLLLRRDGKRYVVRDAATLSRFEQLYAESVRLGDAQGRLGDRQGQLGDRQGEIGERMGEIGARIGRAEQGQQLAEEFRAGVAQLRQRYRREPPLRVFYQVWDRPLYTLGGRQIISQALEVCGGRNVFADLQLPAPQVSIESVLSRDPQVILAGSGAQLSAWQRWPQLSAVRHGRLWEVPDKGLERPSFQMLGALQQLCAVMAETPAP